MRIAYTAKLAAAAGLAIGLSTHVHAQLSSWTNAGGGLWSSTANWDTMNVPNTFGESAEISVLGTYTITGDTTAALDDLDVLNPDATLVINPAIVVTIGSMTTCTNNGLIVIAPNTSPSNSILFLNEPVLFDGTGTIRLNDTSNDAQISSAAGTGSFTNGSMHTVEGLGEINSLFINDGLVDANASGQRLELRVFGKTNNSVMRASNGGILEIEGITVTQGPAGVIRADDGTVDLETGFNMALLNGTIESLGTGGITVGSGIKSFTDVHFAQGDILIDPSATLSVLGAGLVNDGTITVAPNTSSSNSILNFGETGTLGGTGTVILNDVENDAQLTSSADVTVTHGADHLIRGGGQIAAAMVNNGVIRADSGSLEMSLRVNDKTNNALIETTGGGGMEVEGITITQGPMGVMRADGSVLDFQTGFNSALIGGTLESINGGQILLGSAVKSFTDVHFAQGDMLIDPSSTLNVLGAGLVNDGTITVAPNTSPSNAILNFGETGTLGGTGTVILNDVENDAQLTSSAGVTVTNAPTHTIRGGGEIAAAMINNGVIRADFNALEMSLRVNDKTNNALIETTGDGGMEVEGITITQGPMGVMRADGSVLDFETGFNGELDGGTIEAINGGEIQIGSGTKTFTDVFFAQGHMLIDPSATLGIRGAGLVNDGTITVAPNTSPSNALLRFEETSTLGGSGTVVLNDTNDDAQLTTLAKVTGTLGPDLLVTGLGQIGGTIVSNARHEIGFSAGTTRLAGSLTLTDQAELEIELGGTSTALHDNFTSTGSTTLTLGGLLEVVEIDMFEAMFGQSFVIATAQTIAGSFDSQTKPDVAPYVMKTVVRPNVAPDQLVLYVTCEADITTTGSSSGGATFGTPDFSVNIADLQFYLTVWQNDLGFTAGSVADVNTTGSTNGMPDGEVNLSDLQYYLNVWQNGLTLCP